VFVCATTFLQTRDHSVGKMNSLFSRPLRDYVFGIRARGCAALLAPVGENTHAAEVRQSVECTLGVIQQTRAGRFKNFVQAECRGRSRLTHPRIRDNGPFIWEGDGKCQVPAAWTSPRDYREAHSWIGKRVLESVLASTGIRDYNERRKRSAPRSSFKRG
jgi:hypothetical protein